MNSLDQERKVRQQTWCCVHWSDPLFQPNCDLKHNNIIRAIRHEPLDLLDLYRRPRIQSIECFQLSSTRLVTEACHVAFQYIFKPEFSAGVRPVERLSAAKALYMRSFGSRPSVFPLRKFCTEQMFVLLRTKRMQPRSHADTQAVKRSQR